MTRTGRRPGPVIAVDGHAASGKGTLARAIAAHLGLPHLDTGLLYRAVAVATQRAGIEVADAPAAARIATLFDDALLADPALRTAAAGEAASVVSAHPAVRAALLDRQRAFAFQDGGAVLDGRDIGTVIAPDADAKLFVTASLPVRAARRALELPPPVDLATLAAALAARDARDSARPDAPLARAADAALLDTSDLSIDAAVRQAIALVEARLSRR